MIDPERLYAAAGLDAPDLGIEVVMSGRDGRGRTVATFLGDPAILEQDPVTAR